MQYITIYFQIVLVSLIAQLFMHSTLCARMRKFYRERIEVSAAVAKELEDTLPVLLFITMVAYSIVPLLNLCIVLSLITGEYNRVVGSAVVRSSLNDKVWRVKPYRQT